MTTREERDRQIKIWHSLPEETKKEIRKLKRRVEYNPKCEQEARESLQEFEFLMGKLPRYLSYEGARQYATSLGFKNTLEWTTWCKAGNRPGDIPYNPNKTYHDKGWTSWGDFLGTGTKANANRPWKSFTETQELARSLGLWSTTEWIAWSKSGNRPSDIPAAPDQVYRNKGWTSWGDFLGNGRVYGRGRKRKVVRAKEFMLFTEAREFVQGLGLIGQKGWERWKKSGNRPVNIPSSPDQMYRGKGWTCWGDFLGNGDVRGRRFRSFTEAREFAQSLGLKGKEWDTWCKSGERPVDMPSNPPQVYRDKGWTTWGDFLGTGTMANGKRPWRSFAEAQELARSLGLKNQMEWKEWSKSDNRPDDIPYNPSRTYHDKGWTSWGDFLGTGAISSKKRRSFAEVCKFARSLGLKRHVEWLAWCKSGNRPNDIPYHPSRTYRDKGWTSWDAFLGTVNKQGGARGQRKEACKGLGTPP